MYFDGSSGKGASARFYFGFYGGSFSGDSVNFTVFTGPSGNSAKLHTRQNEFPVKTTHLAYIRIERPAVGRLTKVGGAARQGLLSGCISLKSRENL